ncbi:MAG: universal stress protein [Candidatus Aminicenantes bacterium]
MEVKKILCPTDFSEPSYKAVKAAGDLAEKFSAELILLHVVSPVPLPSATTPPSGFNVSLYQDELKKSAEKSLNEIKEKYVSSRVNADSKIIHGHPADRITKTAEDENYDMIVIATHGLTGLKHLVFGSVAEKVVRTSSVPVLTIRAPEESE